MSNEAKAITPDRRNDASPVPQPRFHQIDRSLAPDLLRSVRSITMFLYGTADQSAVRSVYHTIEKSNTIPTFKVGSITCALKSSIRAKFWSQEKRAFANGAQEDLVRLHILLTSILNLVAANDNGSAASDPIRPLLAEAADTIQRVIPIEAR